ncbi:hypothetical protein DFP72DRAFT_1063881 [Ephemerocybe angulata]|uniref:Uncharacterized protein n=1 Tax=Ephemerocybe angulata TaxID=980116 RepID=A0A8H6I810_9AGAR|nr:hypothetical protein DFP72DRAFT_1063881 [Tulosesus angulatus]
MSNQKCQVHPTPESCNSPTRASPNGSQLCLARFPRDPRPPSNIDDMLPVQRTILPGGGHDQTVPVEIIRHIATFRCCPPPSYTYNSIDDAYPLDATDLPHHQCDWVSTNFLLASSAFYSQVADLSWQSPRAISPRALRAILDAPSTSPTDIDIFRQRLAIASITVETITVDL